MFSYVDLEARIRRSRLLRAARAIVNEALSALEREFAALFNSLLEHDPKRRSASAKSGCQFPDKIMRNRRHGA